MQTLTLGMLDASSTDGTWNRGRGRGYGGCGSEVWWVGQGRAGQEGLEHAPSFSQSAYVGFADTVGTAGHDGCLAAEHGRVEIDVTVDRAGDFVAGGHREFVMIS